MGLLLLLGLLGAPPASGEAPGVRNEVQEVLDRSAEGWNRGSVDQFMESYADDPDTLFVGPKGVLRGFARIKAKYHGSYEKDPQGMGTLSFTDLEVRPLGADHAIAVGKWNLLRGASKEPQSGYFSLTFERRVEGWRIICDHTD